MALVNNLRLSDWNEGCRLADGDMVTSYPHGEPMYFDYQTFTDSVERLKEQAEMTGLDKRCYPGVPLFTNLGAYGGGGSSGGSGEAGEVVYDINKREFTKKYSEPITWYGGPAPDTITIGGTVTIGGDYSDEVDEPEVDLLKKPAFHKLFQYRFKKTGKRPF